jgi:hypothetical protein
MPGFRLLDEPGVLLSNVFPVFLPRPHLGVTAQTRGLTPDRMWDYLAAALLLVAALLVVLTFTDYGVTWDEDLQNWYGGFALDYYLSLFTDTRAVTMRDLHFYGAGFDMIAAALNRVSPLGLYETRHLLNGIVGVLGLVGCWRLGRALGGPRVGLLALLLLLLTPNYYGQMFNNPKDIPFAVGGVWASYYMVRLLPLLPAPPFSLVVKLGLAIGIALAVRVGGLLFLCYLGLLLAIWAVWQAALARRPWIALAAGWTTLLRVLLPAAAIAWAVMLIFWPWGQQDPWHNSLAALAFFSHQSYPYKTLFDGRLIFASLLPWQYLPTYILLALPELVVVLLLAAIVLAAVGLAEPGIARRRERLLGAGLVGFSIVFPIAYAIAIKAVLFDGMRHFIFVLPPIAVVAALALDRGLDLLKTFPYYRPVYAALGLYAALHVTTMVLLHPDQYVYYNAFAGGVDGAQRRFKLDYWANSYAEAVHGLEGYLRHEYGAGYRERQFTVAVCGPPNPAVYYFPGNFHYVAQRDKADFYIAFTKDDCDLALPGRAIYHIDRMGALLSVVLDRRANRAAPHLAATPLAHVAPPRGSSAADPPGGRKAHGI